MTVVGLGQLWGIAQVRRVPLGWRVGEGEGAAVAFGAAAQVGQSAAPGGGAQPDPVVADLQGDPVGGGGEVDLDGAGVRVAGDVAQRLAQHRHQVVGEVVGQGVEQAGEPQRGVESQRVRLLGGHVEQPGAQPAGGGLRGLLQLEDAGADLGDRAIEVRDRGQDPVGGPARAQDGPPRPAGTARRRTAAG